MEDYFEGLKYGYHQLRLQFVNHMVQERDILYDELVKDIKMCYGGFEDCETFTYKTYCQKMMQNKVWCDIVALKVIASMWAAKITVINADNLYRTDIRHEGLPQDADIVLLFNANYINGHYVSCLKTDGTNFMIGIPEVGEGYRRNTDRIERKLRGDHDWMEDGEEELICIPMSIYRKLIYKSEQYDKMKEIADEMEVEREDEGEEGGDLPPLPRMPDDKRPEGKKGGKADGKGDDGGGSGGVVVGDPKDPKTRKKRGGEFEPEKEFGENEIPDDMSVCPRCKVDQKTHSHLLSHIKKFHRYVFNFLCDECDKGFVSKYGYNMHKKTHKKEKIKCEKEGCTSEFSTKKSYKQYLRVFHPKGGMKDYKCKFKNCGKIFKTTSNLKQHERGCKNNPDRLELVCDICGKGKFYNQNKVQEHKRDIHGWH